MNPVLEGWINTVAFSFVAAGATFFTTWGGGGSPKIAGIAAGTAFFGSLASHFKSSPLDTPSTSVQKVTPFVAPNPRAG